MKKLLLLLLVLGVSFSAVAQIVNIPDPVFKNALLTYSPRIDTNFDNEIQVSEAEIVLELRLNNELNNLNINSFVGIQSFTNIRELFFELIPCSTLDVSQNLHLEKLYVISSNLSSLDVSQNLLLTDLYLLGNDITSLDVSQNQFLTRLECSYSQITSLDVSNNANLKTLSVRGTLLNNLDVSQNSALETLDCSYSNIISLDMSQNQNLTDLNCRNNQLLVSLNIKNGNNSNMHKMYTFNSPNLNCIQVDDENATYPFCQLFILGWCKDPWTEYLEDCWYDQQSIQIPDTNFKNALVNTYCVDTDGDGQGDVNVDLNQDGQIQFSEAELVESLIVVNKNIFSLEGIQYFTNLKRLRCEENQLTTLDASQNPHLEILNCRDNLLTSFVINNPNLLELACYNNQLTSLDVSQSTNLIELRCYSNDLVFLNIQNGNNIDLTIMYAFDNFDLHCIQVDDETNANNQPNCQGGGWCKSEWASYIEDCLSPIINFPDSVFKNALVNHHCVDLYNNGNFDRDADFNNDGEIQYHEAAAIKGLDVSNKSISSLEGIQFFTNLIKLHCQDNLLTSLVPDLPDVEVLSCYNNQLTSLDLSQNSNLTELRCYSNDLAVLNIKNGNNANLDIMFAFDNFDLYCIEVDDEAYANSQPNCQGGGWCIGAITSYSEECPPLGVIDNYLSTISLYPNPVRDVIYLESPNLTIDSVRVYNLQGQLIKEEAAVNELNVSELESGLYFIRLSVEGNMVTKKFVKL